MSFKFRTNKYTKRVDNRGNWEFSFFQKKVIPNQEQAIKIGMKPDNGFNPKNIHNYINPQISKEKQISQKKQNGETLNKAEQIILENYIKKNALILKEELDDLKSNKLNAQPVSKEGRQRLLMLTLENQIHKNNIDLVCNIFLRLSSEEHFFMSEELRREYATLLAKMETIVSARDLVELQFTKLHDQMPPLNSKSFQKFDPWQINIVENIDSKKSTVVSAPTSAGKTVLAGYATTKGNTLIVVPTDALAWQTAAYVGGIIDSDVPILTQTYQSSPQRDIMIEKINSATAIVGTAETIVDYLPLIKKKFDWIIFDEIHMIGKPEGSAMETIAKVFPDVPFLGLSATIGNIEYLTGWFQKINPSRHVEKIICDKRFFNLQRNYYNSSSNELEILHPLSLVSVADFENKSILKKNLQPTPYDTWLLYQKMKSIYGDLGHLEHSRYFGARERIELSKANKYFSDLITYLVDNFDEERIGEIINGFKNISLSDDSVDLVKLAFLLKSEDKAPAIVFQKNTIACLRMVRQFAKTIEELEAERYPKLLSERLKEHKKARRLDKQNEKTEAPKENSKKEMKNFLDPEKEVETFVPTALQEPTLEFTLNTEQYFSEGLVETWVEELKKYFPNKGDQYHFMIRLLWRGVGVYAKGLPDPYLRLVQSLACKKQLAFVFSDMSLVFGVSMPFRTVVIYRDSTIEDDLDSMLYHQMAGRAGRRGLDKKGNVVFAGYKWKRIEELSICPIPNVYGMNTLNFVVPHANKLSLISENEQKWDAIFTNSLNGDSDEDNFEILESVKSNYDNGWKFAFSEDKNHLHMMWKLRDSEEPIIAAFIVPYIKKGFESMDPNVENNQISIAHFLAHFVNIKKTDNEEYLLPKNPIFEQPSFAKMYDFFEELQIDIPSNIDGRVWQSIKANKLLKCTTEREADEIRKHLFDFGDKIKAIQHFCYHSKFINLSRLLGKLLTRIWWIYHMSSPIMKPFHEYDDFEYNDVSENNSEKEMYEDDSGEEDSEEESEEKMKVVSSEI
ncbi:MAG: DEAD/DEAH box helicase [Bacteroidetes bacterium]|nr:DEAD/DEAH box helicase [Bacteroidota bacterium]